MPRLRDEREAEQTDGVDDEDGGDQQVVAEPRHQHPAHHLDQQSWVLEGDSMFQCNHLNNNNINSNLTEDH